MNNFYQPTRWWGRPQTDRAQNFWKFYNNWQWRTLTSSCFLMIMGLKYLTISREIIFPTSVWFVTHFQGCRKASFTLQCYVFMSSRTKCRKSMKTPSTSLWNLARILDLKIADGPRRWGLSVVVCRIVSCLLLCQQNLIMTKKVICLPYMSLERHQSHLEILTFNVTNTKSFEKSSTQKFWVTRLRFLKGQSNHPFLPSINRWKHTFLKINFWMHI